MFKASSPLLICNGVPEELQSVYQPSTHMPLTLMPLSGNNPHISLPYVHKESAPSINSTLSPLTRLFLWQQQQLTCLERASHPLGHVPRGWGHFSSKAENSLLLLPSYLVSLSPLATERPIFRGHLTSQNHDYISQPSLRPGVTTGV